MREELRHCRETATTTIDNKTNKTESQVSTNAAKIWPDDENDDDDDNNSIVSPKKQNMKKKVGN